MLTYTLVGFIAGAAGQLVDWSGSAIGVPMMAARVIGGLMMIIGLVTFGKLLRGWWAARRNWKANAVTSDMPQYPPLRPNWLTRQLIRLRPTIGNLPAGLRGLVVGLLTALLPCGWLYLFALLAASCGSAVQGALLMLAFWLGSVPALVSLIVSTRLLASQARKFVPTFGSLLLIVAGAYTAWGRGFSQLGHRMKVESRLLEQSAYGTLSKLTASQIDQGMRQLVATPLPCCQAGQSPSVDGSKPSLPGDRDPTEPSPSSSGDDNSLGLDSSPTRRGGLVP
jgi:hypothetical protein